MDRDLNMELHVPKPPPPLSDLSVDYEEDWTEIIHPYIFISVGFIISFVFGCVVTAFLVVNSLDKVCQ